MPGQARIGQNTSVKDGPKPLFDSLMTDSSDESPRENPKPIRAHFRVVTETCQLQISSVVSARKCPGPCAIISPAPRVNTKQKAAYRDTLTRLRGLIHDLEQDSAQEQLAS